MPSTSSTRSGGSGAAPVDALAPRDRAFLGVQRLASYLFFPVVAAATLFWLRGVWRLSLRDPAAARRRFRELASDRGAPILLCSNHLTLVDSMILAWALAPAGLYFRHF